MNSTVVAVVSLACIFSGTLLGLALRKVIPTEHLKEDSKDAVKVGAGMISMMSALVLGLLVGSAKHTYDSTNAALVQAGAKVILLDRVLACYGPEARESRDLLRLGLTATIELLWPEEGIQESMSRFERTVAMEKLQQRIRGLRSETDTQRRLQEQALDICNELLLTRWVQIEQAQIPLPAAFLVILLFWLTMLYASFGLLAPHNATVITVMFIGALALATALFLILEMNRPMEGSIKASSAPMRKALEHLGR